MPQKINLYFGFKQRLKIRQSPFLKNGDVGRLRRPPVPGAGTAGPGDVGRLRRPPVPSINFGAATPPPPRGRFCLFIEGVTGGGVAAPVAPAKFWRDSAAKF
jgi:hypothetical protein